MANAVGNVKPHAQRTRGRLGCVGAGQDARKGAAWAASACSAVGAGNNSISIKPANSGWAYLEWRAYNRATAHTDHL